jgi:hypothetical protein
MHSIHILVSSIAIRHVYCDKTFAFPCSDCFFVKVVRLACEEDIGCFADVEVFEEGLARIYSCCHCALEESMCYGM